eukprot:m.126005 g.126005  ORF g.126005 m.126005 type:complete len:132 (-) comp16669_c0_seq2:88-483(-)
MVDAIEASKLSVRKWRGISGALAGVLVAVTTTIALIRLHATVSVGRIVTASAPVNKQQCWCHRKEPHGHNHNKPRKHPRQPPSAAKTMCHHSGCSSTSMTATAGRAAVSGRQWSRRHSWLSSRVTVARLVN